MPLITLRDIQLHYGQQPLLDHVNLTIDTGERLCLVGRNGSGKSTLIRLLLGHMTADAGTVRHGTQLQVAYFDQLRDALDGDKSVLDNLAEGSDTVEINGVRKHVMGYLQDFLFEPGRARQPVRALSGGERNRLLLAKLFTRPFNLLVLDEPTNDLDVETLELLEEQLANYQGTLLLVSHDREFIDNVVTSTLVFEGSGDPASYVGGYRDWLRQRPEAAATPRTPAAASPSTDTAETATPPASPTRRRKLGYKEQRELQALPERIEAQEAQLDDVRNALADPALYKNAPDTVPDLQATLATLETSLATLYQRWEALDQ